MYGRDGKCAQNFGEDNMKEKEHLEDECINGRIILKCA
jgi:hypothetical protein